MAQVVGEEAMIPAEPLHRCTRVLDGAQPESGQQDRGGPTLRPRVEELQLFGLELDSLAVENVGRLGLGERQLSRAKLGQRPAGLQLRKPERRVGRAIAITRPFGGTRRSAYSIEASASASVTVWRSSRTSTSSWPYTSMPFMSWSTELSIGPGEPPHGPPYEVAAYAPDGGRDVGPHADRVVVTRVQRHPCQRNAPRGGPGADRGGLSVSGGRGDERERG